MRRRFLEMLLEIRDFIQYAIGDREPVVRRAREKYRYAWEEMYGKELEAAMHDIIALDRKGQITLPARIGEFLNLKAGDRLDLSINGRTIVLRPCAAGLGRDYRDTAAAGSRTQHRGDGARYCR